MKRMGKIAVLMGGISSEREVSLKSGEAVLNALLSKGYNACGVDFNENSFELLKKKKFTAVYNILHGKYGEDGVVQGICELLLIPYTGPSVLSSALAMNKLFSKQLFEKNNIPIPPYIVLKKQDLERCIANGDNFDFPIVVKPITEGSSVGVTIVKNKMGLKKACELAFKYDDEILLEKYVKAREIQVGVLNDKVLGDIEIIPKDEFYSHKAKYVPGMSEHKCPAPLDDALRKEAHKLGLKAHKVLGCEGATRVDLLLDENGKYYLLEVNTLPGMTETSLLPKIARQSGLDFPALLKEILGGLVLER